MQFQNSRPLNDNKGVRRFASHRTIAQIIKKSCHSERSEESQALW